MGGTLSIKVRFQGCEKDTCYLPETKKFKLSFNESSGSEINEQKETILQNVSKSEKTPKPAEVSGLSEENWLPLVKNFKIQVKMVNSACSMRSHFE